MSAHKPGTFEYLEAKIRHDAQKNAYGADFEWICIWYLQNAPQYRGKFRRVCRFMDWEERWGPDNGTDVIAITHENEVWAIQAKCYRPDRSIPKNEINKFLSDTANRQVANRLLIATTDNIGPNARRVLRRQEKPVGEVLRGHLITAQLTWPRKIGGKAPKQKRWSPKAHQRVAIRKVVAGFRKHNRGQLIMACGTGKTLTGLWIHERLKSRRTLLLVPSISLAQQNLQEWGRHARDDFDCLVVCSDESVGPSVADTPMRHVAEMGIDPTTDHEKIAAFLTKRRRRPAVVIATYHSSDRISAGQRLSGKTFELALCDEAHRLVGRSDQKFAPILNDRNIKAKRRLFMTATPKRIADGTAKAIRAADLEPVSMDDAELFGPEFHRLDFSDAISATPPLLTDYRVVVIGVTKKEAAEWVDRGQLVRTKQGTETDARTLASQIGLAKAIQKYDLRRLITFHRSILRAEQFVSPDRQDSFPAIAKNLGPSKKPSGKLWAKHISGNTPASTRASTLRALKELPDNTRGIVSNCACLGEGVDVQALDGIAFIDPKRSLIDIIQAVGRVIRKSDNKTVGTIVVPVFIDETSDANNALEQSAFSTVWQVLKALRAHDQRLAVELDTIRTNIRKTETRHIQLPGNVVLDIPSILLDDFEQAFYVKAVEQTTLKPPLTIEDILDWADQHYAQHSAWPTHLSGDIKGTSETWAGINHALERGHRGLVVSGYTIAKLLQEHRGVRNRGNLPDLSEDIVIGYADDYFASNKTWPQRDSGPIPGTADTWASISVALRNGSRGLSTKTSLADLLWRKRSVPNKANRPKLTIDQVLKWADEHHSATGNWPNQTSGPIQGTSETWRGVNMALSKGQRGFSARSSVVQLLIDHGRLPPRDWDKTVTHDQILQWCDTFHQENGRWPKHTDGDVPGTHWTWLKVDTQLRTGWAAAPEKLSLSRLLHKYRNYRHRNLLPPLKPHQIKKWAREFFEREGKWPTVTSGPIPGTTNTWQTINAALVQGQRKLPGGDSLPRFLHRELGVRHRLASPRLSIKRILRWADLHYETFGVFPTVHDKRSPAEGETWMAINAALERGHRGLGSAGGISLAGLLAQAGRVARGIHKPPLTLATILDWARAHHQTTGSWPTESSGPIAGTTERWDNIAQCVRMGLRQFPAGQTLKKLIDTHCRSTKSVR